MQLAPLPDPAPRRLLLGFSAGLDSTALLHRLAAQAAAGGPPLRALHVHHGLHPEADRWAEQARQSAAALGVALRVERAFVPAKAAGGLEQAAREARYAAFAQHRQNDECLVLAHHRDDQAETVLLALLRGSGERGLAAMRAFTCDARGPIWRPLLGVPRAAILAYAKAHGLDWVDDPSNAETRHRRNALRHEVLPALRRHWPHADAALARSAALLAEADALCSAQADHDLAALRSVDGISLDAARLRALPEARARSALRRWMEAFDCRISSDALKRVFDAWTSAPPGRALRHALGRHWLYQWRGRLWCVARPLREPAPQWAPWAQPVSGEASLQLLGADALPFEGWRANRAGLLAHGGHPQRRSAHQATAHMARRGMPPWQRGAVPLLCDAEGRLQAVADLHYAADFDTWLGERNARLLWQPVAAAG